MKHTVLSAKLASIAGQKKEKANDHVPQSGGLERRMKRIANHVSNHLVLESLLVAV